MIGLLLIDFGGLVCLHVCFVPTVSVFALIWRVVLVVLLFAYFGV